MRPFQEKGAVRAGARQDDKIPAVSVLDKIFERQPFDLKRHVVAVRWYTKLLLKAVAKAHPEYELDERKQILISEAALFHDIGKIMLPGSILYKKEGLTAEEWNLIRAHPFLGAKLIALVTEEDSEYIHTILDVCRYHHERWDGKGYPYKLCGEDIPLSAQIVGLADVYDALTQERCYKERIGHTQAVKMILDSECGAFSPLLLDCFSECHTELYHALYVQQEEKGNVDKL